MSFKIQINSLEALERLIGGDTEVEIEIRNNIVQEFTTKHLKGLVNSDLIAKTERSIKEAIRDMFFNEVKTSTWGSSKTVFNEEILNELRKELSIKARDEMSVIVSDRINELKSIKEVDKRLNEAADYITDRLTEKALDERLDRLVQKRLKEKLGMS